MPNWSEEDFNALQAKRAKRVKKDPGAQAPVKQTATQKMQALGRIKTGEMNKTEQRFAQHLELQRHTGAVGWWKFEGIKLMLAKNTSITVDFAVLPADNVLTMFDVKGAKALFTDDARAKMKIAAAMYPFVFKVVYPKPKGEGDGWIVEEIAP